MPGTNTLEKKNKDLNKATRELEAKMKNLQQKTRSLPKVTSHSASAVGPKVNTPKVSQGGGSSTKLSLTTAAGRLRELPSTPAAGGEAKKGSTVTSRAREREADFQKQVSEIKPMFRMTLLLLVSVSKQDLHFLCRCFYRWIRLQ